MFADANQVLTDRIEERVLRTEQLSALLWQAEFTGVGPGAQQAGASTATTSGILCVCANSRATKSRSSTLSCRGE